MSVVAPSPSPRRQRILPGPDQVALRALGVTGVVVALLAADVARSRADVWVQAATVALAAVVAIRAESIAGALTLCGTAYAWAWVPAPLSPLVLVVLAGMVLTHVCALVAAQAPATARVDPRQAWRWLRRGVGLWLAGAAVWGLALLVEDHPGGRTTYAAGLLLLAAVAALGAWTVGRRVG